MFQEFWIVSFAPIKSLPPVCVSCTEWAKVHGGLRYNIPLYLRPHDIFLKKQNFHILFIFLKFC
jgi:hypothetical protein